MKTVADIAPLVTGLAFALAFVFGFVSNRVNFCTMGALSDGANFGDWRRMRMWALAIAVAIAGTAVLLATGRIDASKSIYVGPRVAWLAHLVGGASFGFGMALASGCGAKTLVRVGGGNLKSLIVLIMIGLSAYMTLKGVFAGFRAFGLEALRLDVSGSGAKTSDLAALGAAAGLGGVARWLVPAVATAAIGAWVFADRDFRATREMIVGGVVIGLLIVGGWFVSGHVGYLAEDPATLEEKFVATNTGRMESFSFVAPAAYLLELLLFWTDTSRVLTFGIASGLGVMAGSAAYALVSRTFRWEGFASVEDLTNHLVGGLLMGFGGVTALGCTIGQGITGLSTLAVGSVLTFVAIVAGCLAAFRYQMWRLERTT
ncbi:MAG: YeeE/YedE family protein [Burkholderiales bacterium]